MRRRGGSGLFVIAIVLGTALPRAVAERLTLADAIALARRGQPQLRAADAQIAVSRARIGRAFAPYLPNINLTLQERWDGSNAAPVQQIDPATGLVIVAFPFANALRSTLSLGLDERLFDFGRTRGAVAAARINEQQARVDRSVRGLDVELAVFEAYTDALRGRALEQVQQLGVEQVERQLKRARALYKATLRPEIDVLSAETQLAQARIRLLQARNITANAFVALRNAIGSNAPSMIDPVEIRIGDLSLETRAPQAIVDEAVGAREELHSIELQSLSAGESLRAARADYFPVFSVGATASMVVTDQRFGPTASLFATFTIAEPVFNGWATRYAIAEQRANIEAVRFNFETQRLRIVQEVEAARLAVELSRASLAVAEVARRQSERQLALSVARYESKVGSFVELNDARNGVVNAMATEVEARYGLSKSRGQLLRRTGNSVAMTP